MRDCPLCRSRCRKLVRVRPFLFGQFIRAGDASGFEDNVRSVLDIGGNTGRFALKCVEKYPEVNVTVMDLPQQIGLLQNNISGKPGAGRIHTYPGDLLKEDTEIPGGFDVVWMSQFLDCFQKNRS